MHSQIEWEEGPETAFPQSLLKSGFSLNTHWTTQELVSIGIFSAVIKASTLLVAFLGGGMNPITLILKNCLFATLMVVLLHKIPKTGTLSLATLINSLLSFMLMGQGILHSMGMPLACVLAESIIFFMGGYGRTRNLLIGILILELCSKLIGLGLSWLMMREQPGMVFMVAIFVAIGTAGTFIGLVTGVRFTKELRHAGIISY